MAILLVLVDHFGYPLTSGGPREGIAFAWVGAVGVNIFFSLSGFLIGRLLLSLAEQGVCGPRIATFWARRWLRTLPLYYVVLTFMCWYTGRSGARSYLFLQNFTFNRPQPLVVSWSLVLEEFFYLLYPLLMLLAARIAPRRLGGTRSVVAVGIGLILACNVARWAISRWNLPIEWPSVNPFVRLDCCAYGVLAAYAMAASGARARQWMIRFAPVIVGAAAIAIVVEGVVTVGLSRPGFAAALHFSAWSELWLTIDSMFVPAVAAAALPAVALSLPVVRSRFGAAARWISVTSYAIYLVHTGVIAGLGPTVSQEMGEVAATAALVLVTLALAWLLNHAIERPFLRLRDALVPDRRGVVAA